MLSSCIGCSSTSLAQAVVQPRLLGPFLFRFLRYMWYIAYLENRIQTSYAAYVGNIQMNIKIHKHTYPTLSAVYIIPTFLYLKTQCQIYKCCYEGYL